MRRLRMFLRRTGPNTIGAGKLAYVALNPNGQPALRAWTPFRATQLVGGRRWSLSVIHTEDLTGPRPGNGPVDRPLVEEALDALTCELSSPHEAAELLRRALS